VPLSLWSIVWKPNVRNENIHIFLPVIHHIAHARAHLWTRQCGYTKQAARSHSPTVRCTFNPNVTTQVLSKERKVWVLVITLNCERAESIWGEGARWARPLLQRFMLKQLIWYYKKKILLMYHGHSALLLWNSKALYLLLCLVL